MKADTYTKVVLTIIAISLIFLVFEQLSWPGPAYAAPKDARYGLVPLNPDGSITVRLSPLDELDVNIKGVDTSDELNVEISGVDTSDELPVNIDEVGGSSISSGGPISVRMK